MEINEQKDTNLEDFFEENADELEGIIQNEPQKNKYETVKYFKMNQFPYFLIGKIVSKFEIDGVNKFLNGVGILIGPSVVLTVGHNLCHMTQNKTILHTKKVAFFSAANGDFTLFEPIKSIKTFTPDAYISALKSDDKDAQLFNDWGLIFLADPIGNSITSLLDIKRPELELDDQGELYYFFAHNRELKLDNVVSSAESEKISIIGYTEYRERYKNNNAYKFLNNFKKKNQINEKGNNAQDDAKKKILSQIVEEGDTINININIRDPTEGLISSSRYYNGNKLSLNGLDYIVLGDERYNKEFDESDADKQIMSESKGNLVLNEEDKGKSILRYQISTYKGQSGSPIFLRYKKIPGSKQSEYIYQFVGLHSRRGPSIGQKNFYESEKMTQLTENLMVNEEQQCGDNKKDAQIKKAKNDEMKTKSIEGNISVNDSKIKQNEIIAINGACDYNLAICVLDKAVCDISSIVHSNIQELGITNILAKINSEFIYTKLLLNNEVKFTGLFKGSTTLSVLFSFGSSILKVPKEYILLQDIMGPYGLSIQNYNFDQNKKLNEVFEDPNNCTSISFELKLNIKKYGEFLGDNIIRKYMENYDLNEKQLQKDFKEKHMKGIFHTIFHEINAFEGIPLIYGKLFKKIRKIILAKLGMSQQAKY